MLIQTTIDSKNQVIFTIWSGDNDSRRVFIAPSDFTFRAYNMQNIGETDFYKPTDKELTSIYTLCGEVVIC